MVDTVYDFDPRNLPKEYLEGIGLCMTCAAHTQYVLEGAIWGCLGLDVEYGMAVTTHMPQPLRITTLKAAAEIKLEDPDLLDELDEIIATLETALSSRNNYAHQSWAVHPDTGDVYTVKIAARGSVTTELIPQTVDEIKSEALSIYDAGDSLWSFLIRNELVAEIPMNRPLGHKTKSARKKRRNRK